MTKILKLLLASLFAVSFTTVASAQIVVQNGGAAQECFKTTKSGNPGRVGAINICKSALSEYLTKKDLAATHVNLGVLLMRKGDYVEAQSHYNRATEIRPNLAEAYINHAASLIYTANYKAAINSIDKAIDLGTDKMPEALFNRAVAYDRLQNYKGAYNDLKQALTLRPDWQPAMQMIARYHVKTSSKS